MITLIDTSFDELPDDVEQVMNGIRTVQNDVVSQPQMKLMGDDHLTASGKVLTIPNYVVEGDQLTSSNVALERWLIQAHAFSSEVAAKVGILGRLFSANTKVIQGGVIHEAKRFSLVKSSIGRMVEVGTAVRLSVATVKVGADLELTLPNLAAQAQLEKHDTRVGITVVGYSGPLGDLLPAPSKLDVESCVEYLKAFEAIQKQIFGETGWTHIVPTPLSFTSDEPAP